MPELPLPGKQHVHPFPNRHKPPIVTSTTKRRSFT